MSKIIAGDFFMPITRKSQFVVSGTHDGMRKVLDKNSHVIEI